MARFDRVLIDPRLDELDDALRLATAAANEKRRQRLVPWPLPGRDALDADLDRPAGYRQWNGGDGLGKPGEGRGVVALAWWTDRTGRKHHRVVGRWGTFPRAMLERLLCPSDDRPPLFFVYPSHVFLKRLDGERLPQAICACGAQGTPEELGWMGASCDACYDRAVEGLATPPAWLDPARATLHGDEGKLLFVAYSPDGRTLAAATRRDEVTLFDASTGLERGRIRAKSDWILFICWTGDGQRIVTGDVTGRLRYYSDRTGLPTGEEAATSHSECFAASPDGRSLARGDRNFVSLVSAHDGSTRGELRGRVEGVQCLAFSPDGRLLAAGCRRGTVTVWDVAGGQERWHVERQGSIIASLSFAPNGQTLAVGQLPAAGTASPDAGRLLLLDVAGGAVKAVLSGHEQGTRSVAFAPDGRLLASGGDDGLVRLWEVPSGRQRVALEWHLDGVCSVAFAPDGLTLASGSFDGSVKLWPRELLRPIQRPRARGPALATP